eukprot:7245184-Prymnesium_polylepis.1
MADSPRSECGSWCSASSTREWAKTSIVSACHIRSSHAALCPDGLTRSPQPPVCVCACVRAW